MSSADPDWSRAFDDPIPLPDGRVLQTLHDAGHYAAALPKALQERAAWQTAIPGGGGAKAGDVRRDCYAAGAARGQARACVIATALAAQEVP